MSRSADAHVMDKENEDHLIRDLTPTKDRFRSSSSHSSLKDHADSSHDVPLVGNISPFKHKSSKIRKDLFDNRSSKTSSPKRDKSAIAKLVRNKSSDCDSDKSNLKSNPIQEKDGDHLIMDELENEKTQTVTTPGVAPEDLHDFEVHSSEKKDSPIKRLLDYKKESENRTAIAQKSTLPETDKFLRDPILQRLKNMTPGTYLPKSYSESNLKSSQLRDRLKSEVPRSDSAPSDSRIKSLSNVVKFSKESIKEGNSASTTTLLGLKSQTNLAKKENKISESPENGNKDDLSLSSSTEKAPKSNKSKSESKSREVQSAPAAAGHVTSSQVTGHVTSELQLEERGAADGESPRQVVNEGNPEEGNPLVNGDVIIPGESQHIENEAMPTSASQSHSQSDAQRDLDKKFAEKVSLRLSSINLTPEKDKSSGGNLSGADPPSIGREKLKIDLNWDSSSHSISSNSGRHDSNDREVQSLNLGRTRNLSSIPAGQVDNVNSGLVAGETSQLVRATVDLALLNDAEEDSQDPSLPQPRPPAAPAPRKASKVMAARYGSNFTLFSVYFFPVMDYFLVFEIIVIVEHQK